MTFSLIQKLAVVLALLTCSIAGIPKAAAQSSEPFLESLKKAQESSDALAHKENYAKKNALSQSPVFIELFTSTNCSACVFADRMLYDSMVSNRNVIALSCPVKDLTALRQSNEKYRDNSAAANSGPMDPCIFRQWAYSPKGRSDAALSIPAFVINGRDMVTAGELERYEATVRKYNFVSDSEVLDVFIQWKGNDSLSIHLPNSPEIEKSKVNASVWLIRYKDTEIEKVATGVNKGRVLRFSNVIQNTTHIAKWHGTMRKLDIKVPAPAGGKDSGGYVVVVQAMMGEPVIAAGKIADYPIAPAKTKTP